MARLGRTALAIALALRSAFADHIGCPGSAALVHASCKVEARAAANCSMVRSEMMARVAGQGTTWQDPNNGIYSLDSSVGDELVEFQWRAKPLASMQGNIHTNKIIFDLETKGAGCEIKACSVSQAMSVADSSSNYCNIRNLYCGVAEGCTPVLHDVNVEESSVDPSRGAGSDVKACSRGRKAPQKVAVLGSGLGAMSAVFYMTNYPGWEQDWDIDVYQMGWRLGGKAASGRTMKPESGSRILEHGLHIFFAGYSNAFAWVKDMYKVWERPADHPLQSPNDAFKPSCNSDMWVNLENLSEPADWAIINQEDPLDKAWQCLYSIPETLEPAPTPWRSFKQLLHSIAETAPPIVAGKVRSILDKVVKYEQPPNAMQRDEALASLQPLQSLAEGHLIRLEARTKTNEDGLWPPPGWCNAGKTDLPATHKACRVFFWRATYMELTVAVGFLADDILLRGCSRPPIEYESLDTWLCRHRGPCGLAKDDLIRALPFAAMFAFINGNIHQPNISAANLLCAGRALESGMLGVGRFGPALTYRMQAGMGEILMTPAYEILTARGVRFHFFHKVEGLYTSDGQTVEAININVQATVKAGSDRYSPLHPVKGLNVWPDLSSPVGCKVCERFFDQLLERDAIHEANVNLESYYSTWTGSKSRKRLVFGQDFDLVLNGITSGALPFVSDDLVSKNADWKKFVETTKTVATVGLQVWTYNTTAELGYEVPKINETDLSRTEVMAAGGPEPYDTWADMTHLLQYETANATATAGEARSVQYWCSPVELDPRAANLSDPTVPAVQTERAYVAAVKWLEAYTGDIMPKWADALYESMVAPPDTVGRDRLRHQYYRLNFEPTELYVLTVAGSVKYRPVPWPTHAGDIHPFKNMALAGDHTRNGFNIGCAEAAVTSGVHLAHALTNSQSPRQYVGYGHNQEHLLGSLADPDHYPLVGEQLEPETAGNQEHPLGSFADPDRSSVIGEEFEVAMAGATCPHGAPQGGSLLADVVIAPLPRATVAQMLPDLVQLGPELDGLNVIPVTFAFGVQSNVCNTASDGSWLDGRAYDLKYHEFILTVPSVRFRNPKLGQAHSSFSYIPRTYVDDQLAMILGWSLSAVDKDQAHLTVTGGFDASTAWSIGDFDTHQPMLSLNASSDAAWVPYLSLSQDSAAKLSMPDFLERPLLGNAQGPPGIPEMFPMCVDRGAALASAVVRPLNGSLSVRRALDILPAFNHSFDSRAGFRVMVNWTAGMPYNCSEDAAPVSSSAGLELLAMLPAAVVESPELPIPSQMPAASRGDSACTHPPGMGGGGGAYLADFVVSLMSTQVVERMLPEGVRLPLELRIVPTTPVIFVFGYQYGVCDNSAFKPWLDGRSFLLNYNEFIMAIPDVEFSDPPEGQRHGSHTFQPRLYLDEPAPMALGWGFGIDKVLAHFEHDAHAGKWSVKDWDSKEEVLALEAKNSSGWLPLPSFAPDSFVSLLATGLGAGGVGAPILGLSGRGYKGDPHGQGFFVCGVISFDLSDHAEVQLIRGEMNVRRAIDNERIMHAFDHHFIFGVRLRSNWTMSFPNDCSKTPEPGASREAWVKLRDLMLTDQVEVVV